MNLGKEYTSSLYYQLFYSFFVVAVGLFVFKIKIAGEAWKCFKIVQLTNLNIQLSTNIVSIFDIKMEVNFLCHYFLVDSLILNLIIAFQEVFALSTKISKAKKLSSTEIKCKKVLNHFAIYIDRYVKSLCGIP